MTENEFYSVKIEEKSHDALFVACPKVEWKPPPSFFSLDLLTLEAQSTHNTSCWMMSEENQISLKIEFTGGLELLFSNQRSHQVTLPALIPASPPSSSTSAGPSQPETKPIDVNYLLCYLRDNLLKERVELFMEDTTM